MAGAVGVLLLAGAAVLVLGLVTGWDRVVGLNDALQAGALGTVLLVLVQATVLPNALVWSGSYALGSGFSLGSGSVVAPAATSVGVLPGLPLLGALPAAGPGSTLQLWWLALGAVAGALAAWLVLRGGVTRRFDASTLLGGLAGVVSGLVFTVLAWTTSGDLGVERLTGLGPRLVPLLVMSTTTLGLSGMVAGAVIGAVRHLARPSAEAEDGGAEETEVIDRATRRRRPRRPRSSLGRVAAVPDPAQRVPGDGGGASPARLVVLLSGTGPFSRPSSTPARTPRTAPGRGRRVGPRGAVGLERPRRPGRDVRPPAGRPPTARPGTPG